MSENLESHITGAEAVSVYRQLFFNAAEGLVLTDYQGIIVEVNPRCNQMFGYEDTALLGQKIEILIPEDARGRHRQHRSDFEKSPSNRSMGSGMYLSGRKKDGTTFPVEISLNHFGTKKELKVMALISDITRRVEAEKRVKELNEKLEHKVEERTQELLRSQNLYVAIARNFPDGTISVFDTNLNYVFFEGKELYQAGIESEKLIGTSIKDRLPEDVKGAVIEHLDNVFSGESGVIEFETKGQVFEINAVPLIDSGGNIKQILVVERNITKQKRAENEILNALAQERALNELKSRFVSMASHEFRTPLSTILSSISLINKYNSGENEEKVDKHIGRIRSSVQNLTGILNDFLSLDKLEEGKIRTNVTKINIRDMVEDLMDELEAVMKTGQKVDVNCDLDVDVILIDGQIIKNILINLTSNAIKYSPENSVIKLAINIKNGEMKMAVSDNGIGIPPEEQRHLFERFFRAKNVTNIGGTGLGLNIVRKYVELLNGDINFNSELGKGTTFVVTLPLE